MENSGQLVMMVRCNTQNSLAVKSFLLILILAVTGPHTFSQGKYQTLGPGGCGVGQNNCHVGENKNMVDKHKNSVDDIAESEDAKKYAELSGIGAANYLKGTSKCMECHGTIVSGKEAKDVEEGVSCESCHGPGSGYKDPHSEGPKGGAGVIRDGYTKSLGLGIKDLKKADILADACVRCHLLTDQKILASGHPDGMKFNYKSGMKSVAKHWKYRDAANIPDVAVFKAAIARRGPTGTAATKVAKPVPPPVEKPVAEKQQQPKPEVAAAPPKVQTQVAQEEKPAVRVRKPPPPPKPVPVDVNAAPPSPATPIELPLFPTITDSTRVDQLLLILKRRLELLYRKTGN
jgi:hypothetical protein